MSVKITESAAREFKKVISLDKRGFVFNNPNATKSCGCGSPFSA